MLALHQAVAGTPATVREENEARRANLQKAMRHCRERARNSDGPAEQDAYRRLVFDLYHNAEFHAERWNPEPARQAEPQHTAPTVPDALAQCREMYEQ